MAITKPTTTERPGGCAGGPAAGDWPVLWPTVVEYLSEDRYADGSSRETATLLVFFEGGTVKICLSDRDTGRTGWTAGESVEACLTSLEDRLKADSMEWRSAAQRKGGKRR